MSDDEFDGSESEGELDHSSYPLHDAAQAGDAERIRQLLTPPPEVKLSAADDIAGPEGILARYAAEAAAPPKPNPDRRDSQKCTALHVALLYGQLGSVGALLECGASTDIACEGSPPLHVAVCVAAHANKRAFSEAAVALLLQHGADPYERDDNGRTALHWACQLDALPLACALLAAAQQKQSQLRAQHEASARQRAAAAAAAGADTAPASPAAQEEGAGDSVPPALVIFQDKHGCTAVHLAARQGHVASVQLLLEAAGGSGEGKGDNTATAAAALVRTKNKAGQNAVHMAALAGSRECCALLAHACPEAVTARSKLALTPADLAQRRQHTRLAQELGGKDAAAALASHSKGMHAEQRGQARTLLLAPPECLVHYTCPAPITRSVAGEAPPENMERLTVLTKPDWGILRTSEFEGRVAWDEGSKRAALADVLRVHDWNYVRRIQTVCDSLPDDPDAIGQLDGDTAVSRGTYRAALAAAGATCAAVDEVMSGRVANAFCAVRPPGHHAGPLGVVTNKNDPSGSHGFCLFNNAAIGAAYAMNVYRHAGVKRIAIVDFDVHHGNGTEACVTNTIPSSSTYHFKTPYSEGSQTFPVWQPWLDSTDKECIFFASVQGYGPKAEGYPVFVYPGSGATCDTQALAEAKAAEVARAAAAAAAAAAAVGKQAAQAAAGGQPAAGDAMDVDGGAQQQSGAAQQVQQGAQQSGANGSGTGAAAQGAGSGGSNGGAAAVPAVPDSGAADGDGASIEEDPDREFVYRGGQVPPLEGPRVIDIGIPGFGPKPALWRRSWRDKVLPALAKFKPDMIFICAGFDAHKKDEINFRYIGVTERDFEWITEQLVAVSNRCCQGRIVSVLEGGYRIQGALVSAFARSVAAHVKALAEPNAQIWDPADAKAEREHEKRVRAEADAKRAAERQARLDAKQAALMAKIKAQVDARVQAQVNELAAQVKADGHSDSSVQMVHGGLATVMKQAQATPQPLPAVAPRGAGPAAPAPTPAAQGLASDGDDESGRKRRRRGGGGVDYVALNRQLEEEAAARKSGGGS